MAKVVWQTFVKKRKRQSLYGGFYGGFYISLLHGPVRVMNTITEV